MNRRATSLRRDPQAWNIAFTEAPASVGVAEISPTRPVSQFIQQGDHIMDHVDETREQTCYEKAKAKGMPTFTLTAQDITAALCVDFWQLVQNRVRAMMHREGVTEAQAVEALRITFGIPAYAPIWETEKLNGAAVIARDMDRWPTRRLAD